jgi:hypothetical protein
MRKLIAFAMFLAAFEISGQIKVDPATVNVNAQGASTVFLSYGSVRPDQFSVEALWCAEIVPAAPDIGFKCDPSSTWGRLPLRNDLTRPSGTGGFTDIMTIPQNVARRAYQRAASSPQSSFYYVRRFSSSIGKPDEYIAILCRLTGGGAKVPLALTDVKLRFANEKNVLSTPVGEPPPPLQAQILYTGTGRLIGRWEVVMPGEESPTPRDLVPEGSLPIEERSSQKRFTQLSRFNVYLPPTGSYRLEGPEVSKLPTSIEGLYQVLLRIEASNDGEGNTDLSQVGSGAGVVTSGGVAGFSLPVLRYYVGGSGSDSPITLVHPQIEATIGASERFDFAWKSTAAAGFYRLDLHDDAGAIVLSALVDGAKSSYAAPPLLEQKAKPGKLTWRVVALDGEGREISRSSTGTFRFGVTDAAKPEKRPDPQ